MLKHSVATSTMWITLVGCAATQTVRPGEVSVQREVEPTKADSPGQRSTGTAKVVRPELRRELLGMRDRDQALRGQLSAHDMEQPDEQLAEKIRTMDVEHARRLEQLVEQEGRWPGVDLVGPEGADAAWLLAQHADHTPALQRFFLDKLRAAVDEGHAPPRHLAYLADRVRLKSGKAQLYGTQFEIVDGELELKPVAEPEKLDDRRAQMGLPSMEEYKKQMKEILFGNQAAPTEKPDGEPGRN